MFKRNASSQDDTQDVYAYRPAPMYTIGRLKKGLRRSKHKLYRNPYKTVFPIDRRAQYIVACNSNTGFVDISSANASPYLGFSFGISGVLPVIGGTNQTIQNWPNYSEFQSVFDNYKLKSITVTIYYAHNSSNNTTVATTVEPMPVIYQALDFDSVGGTNSLNEYSGCKTRQFGNTVNGVTFRLTTPTVRIVAADNSATSLAVEKVSPWLDSSVNTQHYGMRFQQNMFASSTNVTNGNYIFNFKAQFEFRNPR